MFLSHIHNIIELLSFLLALRYRANVQTTFLKFAPLFLGFIFSCDLIMAIQRLMKLTTSNIWFNHLVCIAEVLFYGFVFYSLSNKLIIKRVILFCMIILPVLNLIGVFLCSSTIYFSNVFFLSSIILSGIALSYIYNSFVSESTLPDNRVSGFWIAFGVSIFYSGVSIVFILHDLIEKHHLHILGVKLYQLVPRLLSVVLYVSISIAIILCRQRKSILRLQS